MVDPSRDRSVAYQPFYCEENIWHLCQAPWLAEGDRRVVFVSNLDRRCLLLDQRAGGEHGEVVWDYHVVLLAAGPDGAWWVWDLDCRRGAPLPAALWIAATFAHVGSTPPSYDPLFRVVDAETYVERFASDRRHMRDGEAWRAPPPSWPCIGAGFNLWGWVAMDAGGLAGEVCDLAGLRARFAAAPG